MVSPAGKQSRTEIEVVRQNDEFSLLAVRPITGRTHQIRVHCKHIGFPVVGDDKYGHEVKDKALKQKGMGRLMLHASRLRIPAGPAGSKPIDIEAPFDARFDQLQQLIK